MRRPRPTRLALALTLTLACLALAAPSRPAAGADDPRDEGERSSLLVRAAASGRANAFVTAAALADLIPVLKDDGPVTVLVPTDEAFAKLPAATRQALFGPGGGEKLQAILKYHVLPGRVLARQLGGDHRPRSVTGEPLTVAANDRGIAINNATVVAADVLARNGVIHFIDAVLTPPAADLLRVAEQAGKFGVLLELLDAADLKETLRGDGPFTVFAPTDEAFKRLGKRALQGLAESRNRDELRAILKAHVVAGRLTAREAVATGEARTLQGGVVPVTIKQGRVAIGGATALATDIEAGNGIIHAIDGVLAPEPKK